MKRLEAQLEAQLLKQKYEYELEIEKMKQGVKLETNAMDNLPTKEIGMQLANENIEQQSVIKLSIKILYKIF